MTIQDAIRTSIGVLRAIYEEPEAVNISHWLIEHLTGTKKGDRVIQKEKNLTPEHQLLFDQYLERLLTHEPVQYILNEAWFCGLRFYVDKNVLIPRPETEELVEWIISNCKFPFEELKILDIGSGSGCIAIALKRKLRKAVVWSCDISEEALNVAKKNALTLGAHVNFIRLDILDPQQWKLLPSFDLIVSNPPYVPEKNRAQMRPNV